MICHILGLGESIARFKEYEGYRIGVNDIYRHTWCDRVVVINSFEKLPERKRFITECRPKDGLWSHMKLFESHPSFQKLRYSTWNHVFSERKIFSGKSSPFVAMTMALTLGFKEIVLWGVDLKTHKGIIGKTKLVELNNFDQYCKASKKIGVSIFKGSDYSELRFPVWVKN